MTERGIKDSEWGRGVVSCAWEIKESLLEEATANINVQRWELQDTSEMGTPGCIQGPKPEAAGGEYLVLPVPTLGMPGVSQALGSGRTPDIHPSSGMAGNNLADYEILNNTEEYV